MTEDWKTAIRMKGRIAVRRGITISLKSEHRVKEERG